ncbi:DUF72 domain-containing protein [bacterium]|nr:DUF72 domain-containing protein [bacterium]
MPGTSVPAGNANHESAHGMIAIGTSGFSFRDWKGVFYPGDIKPADMLGYYARYFSAVEINTTYYGIPSPKTFERMVGATPDTFEFMVKTNKATTHDLKDADIYPSFAESLAPIRESGRLSGILAQFPWRFRNTQENRRYLAEMSDRYNDAPLFVEFRHDSWNRDEVFDFLRRSGLFFVSVDEPPMGNMMPPVAVATGDKAYVRFHGRNRETWWGDSGDRYDYNYSEDELGEWIDKVEELEKTVWKLYAFFNNCHQGYAVRNALMFRDLMKRKGMDFLTGLDSDAAVNPVDS